PLARRGLELVRLVGEHVDAPESLRRAASGIERGPRQPGLERDGEERARAHVGGELPVELEAPLDARELALPAIAVGEVRDPRVRERALVAVDAPDEVDETAHLLAIRED